MTLLTKITILVILALSCSLAYLIKHNVELTNEVADKEVTIKSLSAGVVEYKNKFGEVYTRNMNQVRTQAELLSSKDSTISSLLTKVWASNLKLKDVVSIGSTVTRIVRDTNIVYLNSTDTTYNLSEPPHIYEYVTIKDHSLKRTLDVRDSMYTISHLKRETVEPRKKFFIARWFQAKQNVLYTDKLHSNPFIKTTSSVDITVLDSKGNPKAIR